MSGKRPETLARYKVGYMKDGSILAYYVKFYSNQGASYDIGFGNLDMCLFWADQCYNIPNFRVEGYMCKTNIAPNTAMRSPGSVKSAFCIEQIIEFIATSLNVPPAAVREKNFYTLNSVTPYGEKIVDFSLDRVWAKIKTQSNFDQEAQNIAAFNTASRWRKRGHAICPVKYGMGTIGGYQQKVLLSVNAQDGTIQLTHTGCEIGQGIHVKVAQAVAFELGVDIATINVFNTSTETLPDGTATGGSGTSETACAAAIDACKTLNGQLAPFRSALPKATWTELIQAAHGSGVGCTVTGYFGPPPRAGGNTSMFNYFVWCAGYTQVEIDVLTGELEVLKTSIVYDCGNSLNPAIDVGQCEGGFMCALGWMTTENVVFDDQGKLRSDGTWEYKPAFHLDIPQQLDITFLDKAPNTQPSAVLSSKASGEPPLIAANSVFFACTDAVKAALSEKSTAPTLSLALPASAPALQTACAISLTELKF